MLEDDNYKKWCEEHTKAFGDLFRDAFYENEEAKFSLTAALINISQRNFDLAIPLLEQLKAIAESELDEVSINYFAGLNYEMLGDESMMEECYERVKNSSITPKFTLPFHPYYRTAKFAQRDSECQRSMYYYRKALEFYDGVKPDHYVASTVSHIIYDIATLCLYMHEYGECERFLEASYKYDDSQNPQRDHIKAILLAVQGKRYECAELLKTLNPLLRGRCQAMTNAILDGKDLHYCVVRQDRTLYADFWNAFLRDETAIKNMLSLGKDGNAEKCISEKLTKTLAFMKRPLDCRIEKEADTVLIKCKNYSVKSLAEEYAALFAMKPNKLSDWIFISVNDFSNLY